MLKLRYDENNGKILGVYQENITVPDPFLLISEEKNNEMSEDHEHIYFVESGELVAKSKLEVEQKEYWYKNFFNTSLGWIRREPTLADGTKDNFLNNDLPLFAFAILAGKTAFLPIAYELPDFSKELTTEYLETLQVKNQAITPEFITECTNVKMSDFLG